MPKLGRKRPADLTPRHVLSRYLTGALVTPPTKADYSAEAMTALRQMYLNDQLGDCVIAGAYHVVGVETGNAGAAYIADTGDIIADYSAIGGYVPGDESTDQGCDEIVAQNYWVAHGFANGTKLAGYVNVDPANQEEVEQACYLFENLYIGFEMPDAWEPLAQGDGFIWDVAGDPNPANGHCVMVFGYTQQGVLIGTWGMIGHLTWAALAKYCAASAYGSLTAWLTPDQVAKGQTVAPNGVDWTSLVTDFNAFGANLPVPSPSPAAPVTLAQAQAWAISVLKKSHPLMSRQQAMDAAQKGLADNWPGLHAAAASIATDDTDPSLDMVAT